MQEAGDIVSLRTQDSGLSTQHFLSGLSTLSLSGEIIARKKPTTDTTEAEKIEATRRLAIDAARLAQHNHCHSVVVLDVRGLSSITDFFVLATGTSPRQMRSTAEEVLEMAEKRGDRALYTSGLESESWVLVDFLDMVLHVFSQEARLFYDLDNLWGDGRRVEWEPQPAAGKQST